MLNTPTATENITIGTIIQLGHHRLICGDATDTSLIAKLCGDDKIDLILTDMPYAVEVVKGRAEFASGKGKDHKHIANDHHQTEEQYAQFTADWLNACKVYLSPKNAYYSFNGDLMIYAHRQGFLDAGFKVSQLLVWAKTTNILSRQDYLPQHELILYGWHGAHQFQKSKDKSVLIHPKTKKNTLHPTMKPVGLLRRLILNSTKLGQVVYDPFGGSGSTLIACEQTKRKCLMVELDPSYCHVIAQRWAKMTGETPLIISP